MAYNWQPWQPGSIDYDSSYIQFSSSHATNRTRFLAGLFMKSENFPKPWNPNYFKFALLLQNLMISCQANWNNMQYIYTSHSSISYALKCRDEIIRGNDIILFVFQDNVLLLASMSHLTQHLPYNGKHHVCDGSFLSIVFRKTLRFFIVISL